MQPLRKIASNLLWRSGELLRNPLVTLAEDGRIVTTEFCAEPDRSASTEFYAGVLVAGFPPDHAAAFARMRQRSGVPLPELLAECVPAADGVTVVISGLDYPALTLTDRAEIRRL